VSAPDEGRAEVVRRLEAARVREKAQTLFYRALAAAAEDAGRAEDAEVLNELHADEQHHLSRLTARVLELGGRPADLGAATRPDVPDLAAWTGVARGREEAEVSYYEALLDTFGADADTEAVLREILTTERLHHEHLRGKWTPA
jgi:rubrerythrin